MLFVALLGACGGDDGAHGDATTNAATSQVDETTTGEVEGPWARCAIASDCFFMMAGSCVRPQDGAGDGFCGVACPSGDAAECPDPPGGTAAPACSDITGMGPTCILDCQDKECPDCMFCKRLLTAEGEARICFWSQG